MVGIFGSIIIVLIIIICYLFKKFQKNEGTNGGNVNIKEKNFKGGKNDIELASPEERLISENMVDCTFRTTSGNIKKITFDKNKTMGELIKNYFEEIDLMRYYGRADLFRFVCNVNVIPFGSLEFVWKYFNTDGNNFILVHDLNNLI